MKIKMKYEKFLEMPLDERRAYLKKELGSPIPRFYFWENCPAYGTRSIGNLIGWATVEELKKDMALEIECNKKDGTPSYILKTEILEEL